MSRRGNCRDNAVAESFFQLLKRERIKKRSTERGKKPAGSPRWAGMVQKCLLLGSKQKSG